MTNIYFPDEAIEKNDLHFVCYMIERVARKLHRRNSYVANSIGEENLKHLLSVANVLHSKNPLDVEADWIEEYSLEEGDFDITDINSKFTNQIPTPTQMGKVYQRLITDTALPDEDYAKGILRVYNNIICDTIDNYNSSAFYEPSYVIARAYNYGGF